MHVFKALLLSLAGFGHLFANALATPATNCSSIHWFACKQNATLPTTCGNLAVPLDYTDEQSGKTLNLSLTKFNATKKPVKGSILFNPGGPGEGAREFLASAAEEMLIATGGHYDLIAFDPRGTGDTLRFSCYANPLDEATQISLIPKTTNTSDTSLGVTWAASTGVSEACYQTKNSIGSLLGTAFVARDMIQIVDALGEDGLLRYYGFSYGTYLGAVTASLFPDRVDKMVLDGVVNPREWVTGRQVISPCAVSIITIVTSDKEESLQADDSLLAYFKGCLAAPELCAISRKNATAQDLYNEFFDMLYDIKFNPLVLGSNLTTDVVQYGDVKTNVFSQIKAGMTNAKLVSVYLNAIMEKNLTVFQESSALLASTTPNIYPKDSPEAIYGIQCADITLRTDNLSSLEPLVDYYYSKSQFAGDYWPQLLIPCAQWKMESRERFTGPYQGHTKFPILMVSSPLDPVTPMVSARNLSTGFEGSVVLQQNGIGHTSIAQPSSCTIRATQAYFTNGTMPKPGTICQPDYNYFSNHTIAEVYQSAA